MFFIKKYLKLFQLNPGPRCAALGSARQRRGETFNLLIINLAKGIYLGLNLIDKIKINCADDRFELPLLDHESNMLPLHQPALN